jgi:hypothetical protein
MACVARPGADEEVRQVYPDSQGRAAHLGVVPNEALGASCVVGFWCQNDITTEATDGCVGTASPVIAVGAPLSVLERRALPFGPDCVA